MGLASFSVVYGNDSVEKDVSCWVLSVLSSNLSRGPVVRVTVLAEDTIDNI